MGSRSEFTTSPKMVNDLTKSDAIDLTIIQTTRTDNNEPVVHLHDGFV